METLDTYCCIAIHLPALYISVEETEHSWDKRQSIAYEKINPMQFLESYGIISHKENQIDIDSHGTRPEWV